MMINEIFFSLQGEGLRIGVPTIFVRTTACNLRCSWCDTEYAFNGGTEMSLDQILTTIKEYRTRSVCVTGGEPLWQEEMIPFIELLNKNDYQVVLETGWHMSIKDIPSKDELIVSLDIKCPSSKMHHRMLWDNLKYLRPSDQLKFVIQDREDYQYAKDILEKNSIKAPIIMTPEGGTDLNWLGEQVLKDQLDVRVLPQLHKIIWGDARGV